MLFGSPKTCIIIYDVLWVVILKEEGICVIQDVMNTTDIDTAFTHCNNLLCSHLPLYSVVGFFILKYVAVTVCQSSRKELVAHGEPEMSLTESGFLPVNTLTQSCFKFRFLDIKLPGLKEFSHTRHSSLKTYYWIVESLIFYMFVTWRFKSSKKTKQKMRMYPTEDQETWIHLVTRNLNTYCCLTVQIMDCGWWVGKLKTDLESFWSNRIKLLMSPRVWPYFAFFSFLFFFLIPVACKCRNISKLKQHLQIQKAEPSFDILK